MEPVRPRIIIPHHGGAQVAAIRPAKERWDVFYTPANRITLSRQDLPGRTTVLRVEERDYLRRTLNLKPWPWRAMMSDPQACASKPSQKDLLVQFNKQTLGEVLVKVGDQRKVKTFFIRAGVTNCLHEAAVRSTLHFSSETACPAARFSLTVCIKWCSTAIFDIPIPNGWPTRSDPWGSHAILDGRLMSSRPWSANAVYRWCLILGPAGFSPMYLMGSDGVQIGEPLRFLSLALTKVPAWK